MSEARNYIGVEEVPGKENNPLIMRFYSDAGFPGIKSENVSWCAAFVNACLERSKVSGSKSLTARDFLRWGKECGPKQGAVAVFWREDPASWKGHVGILIEETGDEVVILGGNQGNAVSVARYPKSRLLGYRWPVTGFNSRTYKLGFLSAFSGGIGMLTTVWTSSSELMHISNELKTLGGMNEWFQIGGSLVAIISILGVIYARRDDSMRKGR